MADITTHEIARTSRGGFTHFFAALFGWMVRIGETDRRVRQVEYLRSLSDAELAARGLQREDIVRHFFADLYYV